MGRAWLGCVTFMDGQLGRPPAGESRTATSARVTREGERTVAASKKAVAKPKAGGSSRRRRNTPAQNTDASAEQAINPTGDIVACVPKLKRKVYNDELQRIHAELIKLQYWVRDQRLRVVILFEGRDAAGKGGAIKRLTEPLNPRSWQIRRYLLK